MNRLTTIIAVLLITGCTNPQPPTTNELVILDSERAELQGMWNYSVQTGAEWAKCLEINNGAVIVYNMDKYGPDNNATMIRAYCNSGAIIHTHLNGECYLSDNDKKYFAWNTHLGVMCNKDTINIYEYGRDEPLPLRVINQTAATREYLLRKDHAPSCGVALTQTFD